MNIALVRWRDSMRETGWRSVDDATKHIYQSDYLDCESVGFVVGETSDRLMLALNHQHIEGSEETVGETIVIPKAAIFERHELIRKP